MRLLRGKSFNVKVVDDPPHIPAPDPIDYEKLIDTVVKGSILIVVSYFTCQTISQVVILNAIGAQK